MKAHDIIFHIFLILPTKFRWMMRVLQVAHGRCFMRMTCLNQLHRPSFAVEMCFHELLPWIIVAGNNGRYYFLHFFISIWTGVAGNVGIDGLDESPGRHWLGRSRVRMLRITQRIACPLLPMLAPALAYWNVHYSLRARALHS